MRSKGIKKVGQTIGIAAVWLLIWELASMAVGSTLLLPSPWMTLRELAHLLGEASFYQSCASTLLRVLYGFLLGMSAGTLLGILTARFSGAEAFLSPLRQIVRSTPVTSFIVLVLLYLNNSVTPLFISFLMVTPIAWLCVQTGIEKTDKQLLEMAQVYEFTRCGRVRYIYLPSILPQYLASSINALGIAWKSGVAAEVIATPGLAIGSRIYESKIYLETPALFAWTAAVILLSVMMEKGIVKALSHLNANRFSRVRCAALPCGKAEDAPVRLQQISFTYGDGMLLENKNLEIPAHGAVAIYGASGSGKTTLLRILAGLQKVDAGSVSGNTSRTFLFQEDRLLPWLSARQNVMLVCGDREKAERLLSEMEIEDEAFDKLPGELSGGMQRRVALARALSRGADLLLLDEPFRGLDDARRVRIAERIRAHAGRIAVATHDKEEARLLGADASIEVEKR